MVGFLIVVVFVAGVFVGRYFIKRFFAKGKGKLYTYFMSTCIAIGFCFFGIMAVAIYDTSKNPRITDPVVKDQYFKEDQKTVMTYFNHIMSNQAFAEMTMTDFRQSPSISKARQYASMYADMSKEFFAGEYRTPELHDKEIKKQVSSIRQDYSTIYNINRKQCEKFVEFMDTKKPSLLDDIKQYDRQTKEMLDTTVTSMHTIGKSFGLKIQDDKWVVSQ
ncbi:hypothetical protein [Sulfurospirillum cavolei]|uniref:hypothetical protein n=1 Tax=Sulfurospirillum cavolei TaxID=366522 RepID=UPI000764C707|nr:hypothetical protein [Sulfurospirillum cavolei]